MRVSACLLRQRQSLITQPTTAILKGKQGCPLLESTGTSYLQVGRTASFIESRLPCSTQPHKSPYWEVVLAIGTSTPRTKRPDT